MLCEEIKRNMLKNFKSNNEEADGLHCVQTTHLVDGKQLVLLQKAVCNVIGQWVVSMIWFGFTADISRIE